MIPLLIGQILNQRYRIVSRLGCGGMGIVYKAEDIRFSNRLMAVKQMSQSGLSPQEITQATKDWNAYTGSHTFTYPNHRNHLTSVVWSPDGTRITSASADSMVNVWQAV